MSEGIWSILADVSMNMVYFSRCLKEYGLF